MEAPLAAFAAAGTAMSAVVAAATANAVLSPLTVDKA
jgi:hypothetical protein